MHTVLRYAKVLAVSKFLKSNCCCKKKLFCACQMVLCLIIDSKQEMGTIYVIMRPAASKKKKGPLKLVQHWFILRVRGLFYIGQS